ncbi:Ig-like domain-containing protein [Conexibacter woesei]|uniref:Ig-like domain-containing protein n=1 Tax=Conexibacter woesei TaxID=191495 RepID=UPI0003F50A12|nr:Ig-like domain-containing protein [Conexibacter woesei]
MSYVALRGGRRTSLRAITAALSSVIAVACASGAAHAADLNATTSNFSSVYNSAAGGDVIHLAAGDYGSWTPSSAKSSVVTITAQSGARAEMFPTIQIANIKLDGLTIDGGYLNGAKNTSIVNSTFTGMLRVDTPTSTPNANILIDHNTFAGINVCSTCYEGRLTVRGYQNTQPVGVTISNNTFGPNGDADGVQIIGGAYGVQVGPGNEFHGIAQVSQAHSDAIQLYGSSHTVITGNWLHDNATGIMAPDGSDHETITNNVISTTGYPWPIVMGAATGNIISHNVLPGSGGMVEVDKSNGGATSSGNVVKDNVLADVGSSTGGAPQGTSVDYNLISGGAMGSHDIKGSPTYAGGSSPTSWAGYALAAGSTGTGRADDGTAMGITGTDGTTGGGGGGGTTTPPADTTAPDTSISSGPTGTTNDNTPTYAFTATESGSTFQCKVDSGAWASCTSPKTLSTLADGSHTFSVRATDAAGNTDASPASAAFTVSTQVADTTAPETTIGSGPAGTTNDSTPAFAFTSSESGSTFGCKVDSGAWTSCTSPKTLSTLADGSHTFSVRAKDAAGNTDASPATRTFTIDTQAPATTIASGPEAMTLSGDASFAFSADDAGARFACSLDGGTWTACTSPATVGGLGIGQHTFAVRATDAAGNTEATGASRSWTVALPDVTPTPPSTEPPATDPGTSETPDPPAGDGSETPPVVIADPPAPSAGPTVTLSRPASGDRFTRTLSAAATTTGAIDHVEFWLDGTRIASDDTAPYAVSRWRVPRSVTAGAHTVVARAFATDGAVASSAVNVVRGSSRSATRATATSAGSWRIASKPTADRTALVGAGPASAGAKITVTRCADRTGRAVKSLRVKAGRTGAVTGSLIGQGFCILTLRSV